MRIISSYSNNSRKCGICNTNNATNSNYLITNIKYTFLWISSINSSITCTNIISYRLRIRNTCYLIQSIISTIRSIFISSNTSNLYNLSDCCRDSSYSYNCIGSLSDTTNNHSITNTISRSTINNLYTSNRTTTININISSCISKSSSNTNQRNIIECSCSTWISSTHSTDSNWSDWI